MTESNAADQIPPGGEPLTKFTWEPFGLDEIARHLTGVDVPWAFAAGWAIDLFCGSPHREHEDVEIAVPLAGFDTIREAFAGYDFDLVGAARKWPLANPKAFDATHQTWLRDPNTGNYRLDVFREPHDGDTWICRRDSSIRRPYSEVVRHTDGGLPYLAPEVVLLFKAKSARPKDEADLQRALPHLAEPARLWLRWAVERVHPGHAWLARMDK